MKSNETDYKKKLDLIVTQIEKRQERELSFLRPLMHNTLKKEKLQFKIENLTELLENNHISKSSYDLLSKNININIKEIDATKRSIATNAISKGLNSIDYSRHIML